MGAQIVNARGNRALRIRFHLAISLEDPLAEVIIKAAVTEGSTISVGYAKGKEELNFKVGNKKDMEEPAEEESTE